MAGRFRSEERETIEVALPDGRLAPLLRVRDPRARRIRLLVNERGARLTVPPRASLREAEHFLQANLHWLAQQIDKRARREAPPPFEVGATAPLRLRGEALPVAWHDGRLLRVARDGHGLSIVHPEATRPASLRRALREFYVAEARRDVGQWLPKYLPSLPRPPSVLRIRPLQSLWGSLSPSGALSLDLALVLGPPANFEYVLVHELCHLIHANHSRHFWREVEARCPDWRRLRAWFRDEGLQLKAELRRIAA